MSLPRASALRSFLLHSRHPSSRSDDGLPAPAERAAAADLRPDGRRADVSRRAALGGRRPSRFAVARDGQLRRLPLRRLRPGVLRAGGRASASTRRCFRATRALLDVQSRLLLGSVHLLAGSSRATGADLPALFLAVYLVTLAGLFAAAVAFARAARPLVVGRRGACCCCSRSGIASRRPARTRSKATCTRACSRSRCGVAALRRPRAARASAGRVGVAIAAAFVHPTTGALVRRDRWASAWRRARPAWRRALVGASASSAPPWPSGCSPPGRSRAGCVIMDADWLAVLADKDYLFPDRLAARTRGSSISPTPSSCCSCTGSAARAASRRRGERALVAGLLALVGRLPGLRAAHGGARGAGGAAPGQSRVLAARRRRDRCTSRGG